MYVSVIIAAAGSSRRMENGSSKQLITVGNKTVLEYSLDAFSLSDNVKEIIISAKADEIEIIKNISSAYPKVKCVALGGKIRQESVKLAFNNVSEESEIVAIHDAARPFISTEDIDNIILTAEKYNAVCPVFPVVDTVKCVENGVIRSTIDRDKIFRASTPQTFKTDIYRKALKKISDTEVFTDDCAIVENTGVKVHTYIMQNENTKITTQSDLKKLLPFKEKSTRIGHGYDVHRLSQNRKLIIGGVDIPYEVGLLGHSDADVLLHAIMDALLGAAGLGDIGKHFPDTDEKYRGISSLNLLKEVFQLIKGEGYNIENIDATIIAQAPKLAPFIPQMIINIADVLMLNEKQVNIKATTEEHLGFTGEKLGISAHAVTILTK